MTSRYCSEFLLVLGHASRQVYVCVAIRAIQKIFKLI